MLELTPEQKEFVDAQVAIGAFNEPNEVVQAALKMLQQSATRDFEETVEEIRAAVPDMEAGRGRDIEEVDIAIREKLGFPKS